MNKDAIPWMILLLARFLTDDHALSRKGKLQKPQQGATGKMKIHYSAPQLFDLSEIALGASANCSPGMSAIGGSQCRMGMGVVVQCRSGSEAKHEEAVFNTTPQGYNESCSSGNAAVVLCLANGGLAELTE